MSTNAWEGQIITLKSGIVVLLGINILEGTFFKINKCTGKNKRTGENIYQIKTKIN